MAPLNSIDGIAIAIVIVFACVVFAA